MEKENLTMHQWIKKEHTKYCPFDSCRVTCSMLGLYCAIETVLRENHKTPLRYFNNDFIMGNR